MLPDHDETRAGGETVTRSLFKRGAARTEEIPLSVRPSTAQSPCPSLTWSGRASNLAARRRRNSSASSTALTNLEVGEEDQEYSGFGPAKALTNLEGASQPAGTNSSKQLPLLGPSIPPAAAPPLKPSPHLLWFSQQLGLPLLGRNKLNPATAANPVMRGC